MFNRFFIFSLFCIGVMYSTWGVASSDPTQPPTVGNKVFKLAPKITPKVAVVKKIKAGWVLKSTLISSDRKTAVINNKVLSVGEKVDGAKLINIFPGKVKIRVKGRVKTLRLIKKDVKNNVRKVSHQSSRVNGQ